MNENEDSMVYFFLYVKEGRKERKKEGKINLSRCLIN
jgi:hypothetical protein